MQKQIHSGCGRIELEDAERRDLLQKQLRLAETNAAMAIFLGKQYLGQRDDADHSILKAVSILMEACHGAAVKAGWWNDLHTGESLIGTRNVGEMLMLAVSEIAEVMEGHRKNLPSEKLPGFTAVEEEMADVFIRLADTSGSLRLRLGEAIAAKMEYNRNRPDHKREARLASGGKAY